MNNSFLFAMNRIGNKAIDFSLGFVYASSQHCWPVNFMLAHHLSAIGMIFVSKSSSFYLFFVCVECKSEAFHNVWVQ